MLFAFAVRRWVFSGDSKRVVAPRIVNDERLNKLPLTQRRVRVPGHYLRQAATLRNAAIMLRINANHPGRPRGQR